MKSKAVWALVVLNVLLLAAFIGQWLRPTAAVAQAPRPSDYIMVPGHVQGSPAEVIYIVDTQNRLLSARTFNGQGFSDMAPIPLDRYLQGGGRAPARGGGHNY